MAIKISQVELLTKYKQALANNEKYLKILESNKSIFESLTIEEIRSIYDLEDSGEIFKFGKENVFSDPISFFFFIEFDGDLKLAEEYKKALNKLALKKRVEKDEDEEIDVKKDIENRILEFKIEELKQTIRETDLMIADIPNIPESIMNHKDKSNFLRSTKRRSASLNQELNDLENGITTEMHRAVMVKNHIEILKKEIFKLEK